MDGSLRLSHTLQNSHVFSLDVDILVSLYRPGRRDVYAGRLTTMPMPAIVDNRQHIMLDSTRDTRRTKDRACDVKSDPNLVATQRHPTALTLKVNSLSYWVDFKNDGNEQVAHRGVFS